MNTDTTPSAKPTINLSFAQYLALCVLRFKHFDKTYSGRATSIRHGVSDYMKLHAPRGSGFDSGTDLDLDASNVNKLVFITSFHHKDEHGAYDGWTAHKVIGTMDFYGLNTRVTGRDHNGVKEYIEDTFYDWLNGRDDHLAMVEADYQS
jgi:hypothetical protein